MNITSSNVRHQATWAQLFEEHRRKTKWVCACGWDGRDEDGGGWEHPGHLAVLTIKNMVHYEGRLADILRNLFEFERPGGSNQFQGPRYTLTFRNNASITSGQRGAGNYGASIIANYFDSKGAVPVAQLKHDGHRWVVTPNKKAEHGEVLKLQQRIGTDVWKEPDD